MNTTFQIFLEQNIKYSPAPPPPKLTHEQDRRPRGQDVDVVLVDDSDEGGPTALFVQPRLARDLVLRKLQVVKTVHSVRGPQNNK